MRASINFIKKSRLFIILAGILIVKHVFFYIRLGHSPLTFPPKTYLATIIGLSLFLASGRFLAASKKAAARFFYSCNLLVSFFLFAELVYMRYFGAPFSLISLSQLFVARPPFASIIALFQPIDFLLFADFAFLPIILKDHIPPPEAHRADIRKKALLIAMGFSVFLFGLMPMKRIYYGETIVLSCDTLSAFLLMTPVAYQVYDVCDCLSNQWMGKQLIGDEQLAIQQWFSSSPDVSVKGKAYKGVARGKNLIIVQGEALENSVINMRVDGKELTPNLNHLISESLYFDHLYSQVGGGNTSDAEFSVNTSLYHLIKGSVFVDYPLQTYPSLAWLLRRHGYSSSIFHGNRKGFYNRYIVLPNLGFEKFYGKEDMDKTELLGMGIGDVSFFRQGIDIIQNQKRPFFSYFITLTSHFPFYAMRGGHDKKIASSKTGVIRDYCNCIQYLDKALGVFIDGLKKNGLWENTVVVIVGDHGGIPDDMRSEFAPGVPARNVPLIIHMPGVPARRFSTIGGQVDIAPTLAYLFGLDNDQDSSWYMGKNLFSAGEGFVVLPGNIFLAGKSMPAGYDRNREAEGPRIGDMIIRGNYFKSKYAKK